ncbi:hypothetical protein J7L97_02955 [Candidatus Bathyarchaeota archaeon]|nr:hypothetical protein [Candidatus Bathyarchaeota archaeon]
MKTVKEIISSAMPEKLEYPPPSEDHAGHIVYLASRGYTKLAADHILHKEMRGHLRETVGNVIRQLNFTFNYSFIQKKNERTIILCSRIYNVLLNIALNLAGFEKEIIGFSDEEAEDAIKMVMDALRGMEEYERKSPICKGDAPIAKAVVEIFLSEMKKVMEEYYRPPGSMVAYVAREIEKKIDEKNVLNSFLESAVEQIRNNVYYRMSTAGMCKFGNDYALGLRWLRHLGFVQVSTNPSLAAIAYTDDPTQWEGFREEDLCSDFKTIIKEQKDLLEDPEAFSDDIAAYATEVSIWRNLVVFRPIAIASKMYHGMISLQLNPNIADNYEESVKYALKFYKDAEDFLRRYDSYLLWGYSETEERGRPNIVFKVAGSSPASIDITRKLESLGIGTNNTVTFTVSQEVELILAKMEGRAEAVKKGIPLTTVYETNMGGRLDDHLREVQAEKLLSRALEKIEDKESALKDLAAKLNALEEVESKETVEDMIRTISSRKYLRPINKEPLIEFLARSGVPFSSEEKVKDFLEKLEHDIEHCGILVTKRVYEIFFSPQNVPKWISYLSSKYGLTSKQAEEVLKGIDVLPASKRHPRETLLTLSGTNMTHTEFPNHQMNVLSTSLEEGFDIQEYRESVLKELDPEILRRLTEEWVDIKEEFIRSYELTSHQQEILKEAEIQDWSRYGNRGIKPDEWGSFGATVKTMNEFSNSYENFKRRCIEFIHKMKKEC